MNYYTVALEAHMLSSSKDIKFKDAWDIGICHHKRWYGTREEAEEDAATLAMKYGEQYVYECPLCGQWHLTTQRQDDEEDGT